MGQSSPRRCLRVFSVFPLLALVALIAAGCGRAGFAHTRVTAFGPGGPSGEGVLAVLRVEPEGGLRELVCSFNADVPVGGLIVAEARVPLAGGGWSPWLPLAEWGDLSAVHEHPTRFYGGRVEVDELLLDQPVDSAEVRLTASGSGAVSWRRLDVTTTRPDASRSLGPSAGARLEVGVPFVPNSVTDPDLRSRLCSPTSLAMLINHRTPGVDHRAVVEAAYHPGHDLFGVWPRNIQAAWSLGVPGALCRFSTWDEVRTHLQTTGPLAISITAGPGDVRGMPYESSGGHLLVLTGLTERGDAIVIDPALRDERDARRVYRVEDLTRVWLVRKRGTAYALFPPG